jgi:hypothetical protein
MMIASTFRLLLAVATLCAGALAWVIPPASAAETPASHPRSFQYDTTYGDCHPAKDWLLIVSAFGSEATVRLEYQKDRDPSSGSYINTNISYDGETRIAQRRLLARLPGLFNGSPDTGLGSAHADLRIGPAKRNDKTRTPFTDGGGAIELTTTNPLTGTLTLADGNRLPVTCEVQRYSYRDRARYSNDLPARALPLEPKSGIVTSTMAAVPAPEATCGGANPVPFGHTRWYRIVGAGAAVTLDTAGSSFDTVLGIYDANGLRPLACADDGKGGSPQASATLATANGKTYLVQVGGWGDDGGSGGILVLTRR